MTYFIPDLTQNTKSVTIQLSASGSIGYCPVPDGITRVGIISSASTIRLGLNGVPSSASTVLGGSALAGTFANGITLSASPTVNWFNLNIGGSGRSLYFKGISGVPQVTVIFV